MSSHFFRPSFFVSLGLSLPSQNSPRVSSYGQYPQPILALYAPVKLLAVHPSGSHHILKPPYFLPLTRRRLPLHFSSLFPSTTSPSHSITPSHLRLHPLATSHRLRTEETLTDASSNCLASRSRSRSMEGSGCGEGDETLKEGGTLGSGRCLEAVLKEGRS